MSKTKRKLAAIVFTDIQGFTSLSSKNEPAALKLLDKQRQLIKPIVERYNGKWLKELGDGLLLSFPTSIDAVNCAIFIQDTVKDIDNLNLRIGIHQGEVVYSGNDIVGDDVNIASRLEKFSPVGGIAISNRVNASLERNPKYKTSYIGSPILKGVSQSIKIFCIVSNNLPNSELSNKLYKPNTSFLKNYLFPITGALLFILGALFWLFLPLLSLGFSDDDKNYDKRIAIMYFDNKGDGEDTFFSDGLSEELMSRLSKFKKISVVSRFDIEQYRNKKNELSDIRNKLKADYVLHGSLQKFGENLKIYSELIDLDNESIKWSKFFERKITDLFQIHDELAIEIINNLNISFTPEDQRMVLKASNPNIDSYSKFNAIKYNFNPADSISIKSNLIELQNIIQKDTTYADAYAFKANLFMVLYMHRSKFDGSEFVENIFEWPLMGFEKSNLHKQVLMNTEMALKYDSYNILANYAELILTFHDWILDPYSPLNTRRILVKINDFRSKYPGHYLFDVMSGSYHFAKNNIGLSNDEIKVVEHLKLAVEKTKNIYHDDFIAKFGFGRYCNFLIRIMENNPNSLISDIVYYENLMFDFKLSFKSESITQLLKNYNWLNLTARSIKIGDYAEVIERLSKFRNKTNILYTIDKNPELIIVNFQIDLVLAYCFLQLNDLQASTNILENIDKIKLSNIAKNIETFSFIEPQEWSEWVPIYHTIMAENHLRNKEYEGALSHRKWILNSKSWHLQKYYKMESHSYLAHYYATKNDFFKAKRHIELCLSIYNETYKEGNFEFNSKVNFFFHLIMSHKKLGDDEGFKKYLEIILADVDKMSNRLNFNHKKMFLDRYPINKIMELEI